MGPVDSLRYWPIAHMWTVDREPVKENLPSLISAIIIEKINLKPHNSQAVLS